MRFFFDNCLSPYHASGMWEFEERRHHEIVHLRRKFAPSTPDPEWISALGREGDWIIISSDERIRRNPTNRAAWHESRLTAFFFAPPFQNDGRWAQTHSLVGWWPEITRQAKKTPTGHGFLLQKSAKALKLVYPESPRLRV